MTASDHRCGWRRNVGQRGSGARRPTGAVPGGVAIGASRCPSDDRPSGSWERLKTRKGQQLPGNYSTALERRANSSRVSASGRLRGSIPGCGEQIVGRLAEAAATGTNAFGHHLPPLQEHPAHDALEDPDVPDVHQRWPEAQSNHRRRHSAAADETRPAEGSAGVVTSATRDA